MAKKTSQKGGQAAAARRARMEEIRRAEEARRRRARTLWIVGGVIGAAAVAVGAYFAVDAAKSSAPPKIEANKANVKGEKVYKNLSRNHVEGKVKYPSSPNPPVGGDHNAIWQNANGDVYTKELQNEHAVHALEHGTVWITYNSSASKADIAALKKKVDGIPYRMMSPVPNQPGRIELSAWGHQLTLTSTADKRIDEFLKDYTQGPQTPEPGAAVTGGRDTP